MAKYPKPNTLFGKYRFNFLFDEGNKIYILEVESLESFKDDLFCYECKKKIELNGVYFCPDSGWFFHKECLAHSKHGLHFQSFRKPLHYDHPVIIKELKEVTENAENIEN